LSSKVEGEGSLISRKLIKKEDTHRGENNEHHEEEEDVKKLKLNNNF
jgi:hypothetical protein